MSQDVPRCEGYGQLVETDHYDGPPGRYIRGRWTETEGALLPWPGVKAEDIGDDGCIDAYAFHPTGNLAGERIPVVRCEDYANRPEADPRFGRLLCRWCFYAWAEKWREDNRDAGLCACGLDTLPDLSTCRDCTARAKRKRAAAASRAKREAALKAERDAHQQKLDAYKAKVDALDREEVRAALEASHGDRQAAAEALGIGEGRPKDAYWPGSYQQTGGQVLGFWLRRKANKDLAAIGRS